MIEASEALGAYGLELVGLDAAADWMQPIPHGATRFNVEVTAGPVGDGPQYLTDRAADFRLLQDVRLQMVRGEPAVHLRFPITPSASDLLHPYLAPAAALTHQWAGHEALHAGAFAGRDGAVLLLAGKEGGKSTTLAELARVEGIAIMADDLAVIEGGTVLAGPRCIDLRTFPGEADSGDPGIQSVRGHARRRLELPLAPCAAPIVAVVGLTWSERMTERTVPARDRLPKLVSQRMYYGHTPADELALLDLASLPFVTLTRPRGTAGLRDTVQALRRYV